VQTGLVAGLAFTPGSPVKSKDVFAGRMPQIRQVIDAINQSGRSVLIYGERGVGKTSLANVIDDFYLSIANPRIFAPHVSCDPEDTFHTIWMKLIREGMRARPSPQFSDATVEEIESIIGETAELTPHSVKCIAEAIARTHLMIPIVDEFDRVQDPYAKAAFTDTVKYLSDHVDGTTLVLVGVGDTVDDLVAEHASVERALEQVLMPRMSKRESLQILEHGTQVTGVQFSEEAADLLLAVSQGLPHYTHLLGLHATRTAVDACSWVVQETHVEQALELAIVGSQQSLLRAYHSATTSPRPDNLFKQVLLACAMAKTDQLGYFAAADLRDPLSRIMRRPYDIPSYTQHLNQFCSPDRGNVLQRTGNRRRYRFRFRNPLLQPFVVMQGMQDSFIDKSDVRGSFTAG